MAGSRGVPIFLFLLLSLSSCATAPDRDTVLSKEGRAAMENGDLNNAERLLSEALATAPDSPHALANLGDVYVRQTRYDAAKPLLERVVAGEDEYRRQARTDEESREIAQLVQLARDDLMVIEREETADRELLALTPDTEPKVSPLVRETAPIPVAAPTAAPAPAAFHYQVQVGAFKSRSSAERLSRRLSERHGEITGEKAVVLTDAGGLVRVQIGPYDSMRDASSACRALTRAGVRCFARSEWASR